MKLLYVCSDFGVPPSGAKGASIHLRAITRALCDLGHSVTLLSPHAGPGDGHPATPLLPQESWEACGVVRDTAKLRRYLKNHDLPRGLAGEMRSMFYNEWATARAIEAIKHHPPDAIIERLSLFGHVGLDLAGEVGCPFIVEVNALLSREAKQFRDLEMGPLARRMESRVLRRADAVLAVSNELRQTLIEIGVDGPKVRVVPNGADVEAFHPANDGGAGEGVARDTAKRESIRDELGLDGDFVIGFVGSLKVWHGVDLLVSAFKRVRSGVARDTAKLLIVGAGPMMQRLQDQVQAEGLEDSVTFTGAVDHRAIPQYIGAMDVAVAPFRSVGGSGVARHTAKRDGFYFSPIKIFEYMAAGRCVVASRLGQIEEVITDGEQGLLCEADDVDSLVQALLKARCDPALRRRMGAAARVRVQRDYTWRVAAISTSEVVAGLVGSGTDSIPRIRIRGPGNLV
ncbi:MAG: glycosyltransferase family 4 protein [Phycisphaerae bacterium]